MRTLLDSTSGIILFNFEIYRLVYVEALFLQKHQPFLASFKDLPKRNAIQLLGALKASSLKQNIIASSLNAWY